MPLSVQIISPERTVFSEEGVDEVLLPGSEGQLGVLPKHAALMTTLQSGELVLRKGGEEISVAVSGGFLEVRENKVVVLADAAERAEEIDVARAEDARRRAQELIATGADIAAAQAALGRALVRIRVAERRQRRRAGPPRAGQPPA